jgi:hypothetical protein
MATWDSNRPRTSNRAPHESILDSMLHRSSTPAASLADFVEDFWFYDDYRPRHVKERILPSGTIELVINLRDDELRVYDRVRSGVCERFSGAVVSGTYDRFFVIDTAEEASLLGVHFKVGGAFPFFGLPASELVNAHVDLEALWGPSGPRTARAARGRDSSDRQVPCPRSFTAGTAVRILHAA